jgi:4-hydroxy-2-oxoheptanedioate aldolase
VTRSRDAARRLGPMGLWCSLPTPYAVEILARSGFDWLCVDLQHGFMTLADLLPVMQAAAITATPVLVRVEDPASLMIHRALDAGAAGVIVPTIDSAGQAAAAAALCRYPPRGRRSWGPARLVLGDPAYTPQSANAEALCIVMIESRRALDNLDEILSVAEVDAVLVGPSDLAIDLGLDPSPLPVPGVHAEALAQIAARAQQMGVVSAVFADSPAGVRAYRELGYVMFGAGNDAALLKAAAHRLVAELRQDAGVPNAL